MKYRLIGGLAIVVLVVVLLALFGKDVKKAYDSTSAPDPFGSSSGQSSQPAPSPAPSSQEDGQYKF